MIELNWSRCVLPPYAHQREGVRALLGIDTRGRTDASLLALFDDVGAGKTKQVIDTAHFLYENGLIDTVLVEVPSFAVPVWAEPDPLVGEIAKHAWPGVENIVETYISGDTDLPDWRQPGLRWIVTNYEFARRDDRIAPLLSSLRKRRLWTVFDEAWAIKSHKSKSAKTVRKLRALSLRCTLLNGTPIAHSPLDLFSQMMTLSPNILFPRVRPKSITQAYSWFVGRYAVRGGEYNEIVGWQNLDELNTLVAPYVLRRETRECIDLPPVLPPVTLKAKLSPETWRLYVQMRDELVAWLDSQTASVANQAVVKGLRLAQLCSGFLGGLQSLDEQPDLFDPEIIHQVGQVGATAPREIGREKLDALLEWLEGNVTNKVIIWCRFRAELDRAATVLAKSHPRVYRMWGGQKADERAAAVRALAPGADEDRAIVVGTPAAGGAGLNLAGANVAIYLSNDFNLRTRLQADGRIDRPGQTRPVLYVDVVATGPKGQKTIDHHIIGALRKKQNVAEWSAAQWRAALRAE